MKPARAPRPRSRPEPLKRPLEVRLRFAEKDEPRARTAVHAFFDRLLDPNRKE